MLSNRKNIYFYIGLVSVVVAATGVDVQTLTNWPMVWQLVKDVAMNPLQVVAVFMAIIGVIVNPTTGGFTD